MKNGFNIIVGVIVVLVLFAFSCLATAGLKKGSGTTKDRGFSNEYIDLETLYKDKTHDTEVLYDKNTKVMYFIKSDGYRFGITPIYNSDGTVKLYEGE